MKVQLPKYEFGGGCVENVDEAPAENLWELFILKGRIWN